MGYDYDFAILLGHIQYLEPLKRYLKKLFTNVYSPYLDHRHSPSTTPSHVCRTFGIALI